MAARVKVSPDQEEMLRERYRAETDGQQRTYWQTLWLSSKGRTSGQIADVTGFTPAWIRRLIHRFNAEGVHAIRDRRDTNTGQQPLLNEEQLAALEHALENEAPPNGGLWNSRRVAEWMSQRLNREVCEQRGWEYLRKLGYSPQHPRPDHDKGDPEAREAFKKGAWRRSLPPSRPTTRKR